MRLLLLAALALALLSCRKHSASGTSLPFDSLPVAHLLVPQLNEVSGIADSRLNPGYLWGEEDSGNPPQLQLIRHDGTVEKKIYLTGITNRDWEDLALSNGLLYIAETGDNALAWPDYRFYLLPEPSRSSDTVAVTQQVSFTYGDGPHDAEAFLVDASSRDIFVITKRDPLSRIYRIPYPYASGSVAQYVGSLPFTGVVSAAQTPGSAELLVKTYTSLYYYRRAPGQSLQACLAQTPVTLPYRVEPQGEAVCFAADSSGYFTLSEKGLASTVSLYRYGRK